MKKTLLTITAIISSVICAIAQPDFGFETWGPAAPPFANINDPIGWASLNALTVLGTDTSVFKITVGPATGTASVKIKTIKIGTAAAIPNPFRPGTNLDTAGLLVVGKINISPPGIKYGYTYSWRPAELSFESKYTPVTGDSAFVLAYLTKWNINHRDTIASGKYGTGASTTAYSLNNITLNYNPAFATVMPDSEQIFISSSVYSHPGAKIGSVFYIDDLVWSGYNSTNDINGFENSVSVYPNPANDNINLTCSINANAVEIADITGRLIGSYPMTNNKIKIQTSAFAPGMYIYNMLNHNKQVINRGKFEIAK